jgi:hypothetical protein
VAYTVGNRTQWLRGLRRGCAVARWDCGFEFRRGHGRLSVSSECCVLSVEVSATGWSLVQRSPTECGVSECDRQASTIYTDKIWKKARVQNLRCWRCRLSSICIHMFQIYESLKHEDTQKLPKFSEFFLTQNEIYLCCSVCNFILELLSVCCLLKFSSILTILTHRFYIIKLDSLSTKVTLVSSLITSL